MPRGPWNLVLLACSLAAAVLGAWPSRTDASPGPPATMPASATPEASPNEMCPVMPKEPVDAGVFSDYQGRRVYFCCSKCRAKFLRSPVSYAASLAMILAQQVRTDAQAAPEAGDDDPPSDRHGDAEDAHGEHVHGEAGGHAHGTTQPGAPPHGGEIPAAEAAHHDHSHAHDHATGHGHPGELSSRSRVARFVGKFHPLVVHLPIALLLAALVAEALFAVSGATWLSEAARFCVLIGALGAIVAAALGWLDAAFAGYEGDMLAVLNLHRWLGTTTAAWAVLLAVVSETSHRRPESVMWRGGYRLALLTGAVLVGITGHFGATLIYGLDYLRW